MTYQEFGNKNASTVLIQPVDNHGLKAVESEMKYIRANCERDFCLLAIVVDDWNRDLSPWSAPAVFGNEPFGDGAGATLDYILGLCGNKDRAYHLGGYSLAGLFSLWAACQTDAFEGIMASSPSVWFPGFTELIRSHSVSVGKVYLSLGDKESKSKNPLLSTVSDCIGDIYKTLRSNDVDCTLEWNPGNHFREPDIRCAKGFAWLLNEPKKRPT